MPGPACRGTMAPSRDIPSGITVLDSDKGHFLQYPFYLGLANMAQ